MKLKIDKAGTLFMLRKSQWILALCQYGEFTCNHTCAKFGEPVMYQPLGDKQEVIGYIKLCCEDIISFEEITDERE